MNLLEQILISILTAFSTALLTYYGFWRKAKAELYKEYESRFNERKWNTYLKFTRLIPTMSVLSYLKGKREVRRSNEEQEVFRKLNGSYAEARYEIEAELLLIGSTRVIEKFRTWSKKSIPYTFGDEDSVKLLIDLLNAMREDLGKCETTALITD